MRQPFVRDLLEAIEDRRNLGRREDGELAAIARHAVLRRAEILPVLAGHAEAIERDASLFAELIELEPEVEINRQLADADLIEHR